MFNLKNKIFSEIKYIYIYKYAWRGVSESTYGIPKLFLIAKLFNSLLSIAKQLKEKCNIYSMVY